MANYGYGNNGNFNGGNYVNAGGISGYPQQNYYNNPMPDRITPYGGQYQQPQPASQNSNNGVIWVQGEEGAKAYMVAPGNTVQLWDVENPVIYLKSADVSGMPSMRIFDLVERSATPKMPPEIPREEFVTRKEFTALEDKLNTLLAAKESKPTKSAKAKEDVENG